MRMMTFAKRNFKEIMRDPLNLAFLFGFPVVLLLLLSAIQANIPVSMFEIEHLAPGVAVFGLAFMTLFAATLIAKDRQSSLMQRLYTTPMTPADFILGYTWAKIPDADHHIVQIHFDCCFDPLAVAAVFGSIVHNIQKYLSKPLGVAGYLRNIIIAFQVL